MIRIENLYKLYGPRPREAMPRLAPGESKQAFLDRTGHVVAINGVSLTVAPRSIFVVMGLSGSGKSTLLRCINRLIEPTAGRVFVEDEEITAAGEARLRELRSSRIGMVFQHFALFPRRTVLDNVAFGLEVRNVPRRERAQRALEALELVGLERCWAPCYPSQLSGGMQQRVGLARALAADPDILLLDEPFSALDPVIRKGMQQELLRLQARVRKTVVFITHDLDEAVTLGQQIAIMRDGRIVQLGSPADILLSPADDEVRLFVQDMDVSRVITAAHLAVPLGYLAGPDEPPARALATCRQLGLRHLIVGESGCPRRGVGVTELEARMTNGAPATLGGLPLRAVEVVDCRQSLREILPLVAASALPVAVMKDGRLLGMVSEREVVGALAFRGSGPDSRPRGEDEGPWSF